MFKAMAFIIGLGVGAAAAAFPVASLLLYLLTGKFVLPQVAGGRALSPEDLAGALRTLVDQVPE